MGEKSGLGWIGKNANLIIPKQGSFYFLAEMLVDFPVVPDGPIKDFCGTCTRCIEACPTKAITPYVVDGSTCISYFTIELKRGYRLRFKQIFRIGFLDVIFVRTFVLGIAMRRRIRNPYLNRIKGF